MAKFVAQPLNVNCANCHKPLAHCYFTDKPVEAHPIRHLDGQLWDCYPEGNYSPEAQVRDDDWQRVLADLLSLETELR